MKKRRVISLSAVLPIMLFLCGLSFVNVTVKVDTEKNPVYEYISSDDILADFAEDAEAAKKKYKYGCYIVSGKTENISKKGDTINLAGTSAPGDYIVCSCPKELRSKALSFNVGETIAVYGRIEVGLIDKDVHIDAVRLDNAPAAARSGTFCLSDGTKMDKNSMSRRVLANGAVSYSIPAAWKEVEHSIIDDGIGTIEGYQYVLNQLSGSSDNVPESFFVCYFDNESKLENADDRKETKLIEKAVINNISGEGKAGLARTRDVLTYYGARYNYYVGSYTDELDAGNNGYHAEYIFQKNGDDGLVMYLYIYKDAKHLSDIMFVTRFLETAEIAR